MKVCNSNFPGKKLSLGWCLLFAMLFSSVALAEDGNSLTLKYDILSEREDVGFMIVKLFRKGNGHIIIEHSHIKASGWWGKVDFASNLIEVFLDKNDLIRADRITLDGSCATRSWLELKVDRLRRAYKVVKNATDREKIAFADMSMAISSGFISKFEELLPVSSQLFATISPGAQRISIRSDGYDTTLNNLPFFIQDYVRKKLPRELEVLDTDDMKVIRLRLDDLGTEMIAVGNKSVNTRHLKIFDPNFKPSHVWITEDASLFPYMVRYIGEDEDGDFEIILRPKQKRFIN